LTISQAKERALAWTTAGARLIRATAAKMLLRKAYFDDKTAGILAVILAEIAVVAV
jgi:hypothetical protein